MSLELLTFEGTVLFEVSCDIDKVDCFSNNGGGDWRAEYGLAFLSTCDERGNREDPDWFVLDFEPSIACEVSLIFALDTVVEVVEATLSSWLSFPVCAKLCSKGLGSKFKEDIVLVLVLVILFELTQW